MQNKDLKIALLGNMNNNNFALMRYFRDAGYDAHLFYFSNEDAGTLAHFHPQNDTTNWEKWKQFVHKLSFPNDLSSGLSRAMQLPIILYNIFRPGLYKKIKAFLYANKELRGIFQSFDFIIGSGITPAAAGRLGLRLDIFYPYGNGVEFFNSKSMQDAKLSKNVFKKLIACMVQNAQKKGIQSARYTTNAEVGLTEQSLKSIGVKSEKLFIPMVYVDEGDEMAFDGVKMSGNNSEITILHHCRHHWCMSVNEKAHHSKHNEWVFEAVAHLVRAHPCMSIKLVMFEYGKDVSASKEMCASLGITDHITWLPIQPRKQIINIMKNCDIVIGEFYEIHNVLWGGTAWEAMAMAKPLIQGYKFYGDEFTKIFNSEEPPFHKVATPGDLQRQLEALITASSEERIYFGKRNQDWFHLHNGRASAQSWIDLLLS